MKRAGLLIAVGLIGCKARENAPADATRQTSAATDASAAPAGDTDAAVGGDAAANADNDSVSATAGDPDLDALLRSARFVPAFDNLGTCVGMKITGIQADSAYAKAGMMNDDVITRVDGVSLNGADSMSSLLAALRGAKPFVLEGLRDGKPVTATVTP